MIPILILKILQAQSVLSQSNMGRHMSCLPHGSESSAIKSKLRKGSTTPVKARAYRNIRAQTTAIRTAEPPRDAGASTAHPSTYLNPDLVSMCMAANFNSGMVLGFQNDTDCCTSEGVSCDVSGPCINILPQINFYIRISPIVSIKPRTILS